MRYPTRLTARIAWRRGWGRLLDGAVELVGCPWLGQADLCRERDLVMCVEDQWNRRNDSLVAHLEKRIDDRVRVVDRPDFLQSLGVHHKVVVVEQRHR